MADKEPQSHSEEVFCSKLLDAAEARWVAGRRRMRIPVGTYDRSRSESPSNERRLFLRARFRASTALRRFL